MLTADQLRAAAEVRPPVALVECPALGGAVGVRGLTCAELDAFQAGSFKLNSKGQPLPTGNRRGRLLALALCDADGKRLFSDDDAATLGALPARAVAALVEKAQALSGLDDDAVEEAKGN